MLSASDPHEVADMTQAMVQLAAAMGEVEREKVMAEGSLISLDDAVQVALSSAQHSGEY